MNITGQSTRSDLDISVLIATRNRAHLLKTTLEKLACQNACGLHWEVIVADNGSHDGTSELLSRSGIGLPLVRAFEEEPGKNRALNRALGLAKGSLLVFTDDDIDPSPQWLLELFNAAERHPGSHVFAGPIEPIFPPGTPDWLASHKFGRIAFGHFAPSIKEEILPVEVLALGCNYALRRSVLGDLRFCESIGPRGLSYPMGSETELLTRLMRQGVRTIFVPGAGVGHIIEPHQIELKWLYGRSFSFGRGRARLYPDHDSPRMFGVPRYLFRMLLDTTIGLALALGSNPSKRFERMLNYFEIKGMIHECRILAKESDSGLLGTSADLKSLQ
jgi:L-malate glycosyltransferase